MDLMMLVPTSEEQLNAESSQGFPRVEHKCKIPPEFDELKNVIEGDGFCARSRRWFRRKCLISQRHPDSRFWLKSKATMSYEYTRHANSYIYMIHPFSEFRVCWQTVMVMATLMALLTIPYRVTFFFELPHGEWLFFVLILDCILLCDIVLWFFTGYYELRTNVVVLDPRIIARKYLTSWFFIDLLSSLPMGLLALLGNASHQRVQLYSYSQILKIFRLRVVVNYVRRLRRVYGISFQTQKSIEFGVLMVIVLHWAACAEYYVSATVRRAMIASGKSHENWTNLPYVRDNSTFFKYIVSLYRSVAAMVGCLKHDDLVAVEDVVSDAVFSIFGRVANIYLIAKWLQLTNTFRGITNNSYLWLLPQLREYMRHKELPIEIQNRLTTYYGYCIQQSIDLEKSIMSLVSVRLREELMLHRSRKLVEKVTFFKCLPESVVSRIAMSLRTEIFLTNDVIIKAGTTGDSMYFIASGTVAIYTSLGKEVCHLEDGAHFGEIALIMENEQRVASVVAAEICELYVLTREDFQQAIERYPNLMNSLQKLVLQRLEKTLFLGELYRLEERVTIRHLYNIYTIW
ncbi:potassium/sodium hyperpolarization-activated cyclic nucleotide-gated channel 4-like [Athalia rosae]|uniref:potassium/sodium hyperpolarization-activated cyclic nucleotide-gated channel 4-like n=1 Tax=Athalia rosae TaxID=37344 RepID=UPI002033D5DF|nr:potassium/sodium hyperpolarization-activated cyclic nucleotide-gated channel 4-like [Athalia rosae]